MNKKEQDKIIKDMSVESVSDDKVYKKGTAGQILAKFRGKLDKFGLPMGFNWENLTGSPKELKELKAKIRKVTTSEKVIKKFIEKHGVSRKYYLENIDSIVEQLHLVLETQGKVVGKSFQNDVRDLVKKDNSVIKRKVTKPKATSEAVRARQKKYNTIRKEYNKLHNVYNVKHCLKVLATKHKYAESTIRTIIYKQTKSQS